MPPPFQIHSLLLHLSTTTLRTQLLLQQPLSSSSSSSATKPKWNSNHNLIITNPILSLMESCTSMSELKQIQAHMTRTGLMSHRFPSSRVLAFCALSDTAGDINHARLVFSQIADPNTYIWNTMIRGYSNSKLPHLAFSVLRKMVSEKVEMDNRSFVFGIKASEQFPQAVEGQEVRGVAIKMGFDSDLLVRNGLMHFYLRHGQLDSARELFDESSERDVVSWTTMIDGYARRGLADESFKLFYLMLYRNVEPNDVTMVTVLSACSQIGILSLGRWVHRYIELSDLSLSVNLLNALVDMYGKCGCVEMAREVFDNLEVKDVFSWTGMINAYAKCGYLEKARRLFDEMPERNVVSWSTMIAGYAQGNRPIDAVELFYKMITSCVKPITATLVSVLSACSQSGCLDLGKWIFNHFIVQNRIRLSTKLGNAFIDMYAKCGAVDAASRLFCEMPEKDMVSWNTMILGYAVHGYSTDALFLFEEMKSVGLAPDAITFVGVMSACSHGGLVVEGRMHFENMNRVFGIRPKAEHYACMIDLYGRVGLLEDANNFIKSMPMEPDKAGWGAFLNACRMHGNVELGKLAGQKLLGLDPGDSGTYALLANMYAKVNKWGNVMTVRRMMREQGVKKTPGCSSIEVDGKIHEFFAADRSHSFSKEIYKALGEIYMLIKWEGHVPVT